MFEIQLRDPFITSRSDRLLIAFPRISVNEKNTIMTPFTIIDKLTGPYSFSRTNKESLNQKAELYFHDFSFVPLFMQVSGVMPCALQNVKGRRGGTIDSWKEEQ